MALTINHNLMAMNTARNLNTAYEGLLPRRGGCLLV
jgi:hypothetical protein